MALKAVTELVLATLFLVAGVAKLRDLGGSKEALANFGVPKFLIPAACFLLPALEILLAISLLVPAASHYAAIGTALLTFFFLAAILYQLAKGRKPECHCFGQLYSRPLSGLTVSRSALLLTAAVALAASAPLPTNPASVLWTSLATLTARELNLLIITIVCAVSLVQTFFLLEVMKQNGRLLLKLEHLPEVPRVATGPAANSANKIPPLPVGSPAPDFQLPSITGQIVTLRDLRTAGKSTLLVFSDPACGPCQAFMPKLAAWQSAHHNLLNIAVVSRGTNAENLDKSAGLNHILLQHNREVTEAYRCQGTPGAVLVGAQGAIDSDMVYGSGQITELVTAFTSSVLDSRTRLHTFGA